jgi:hypothetical protein
MVARGEENSIVVVPPLQFENEAEKQLYEAAKLRRSLRKEIDEKYAELRLKIETPKSVA